jgi:hypothetical protein
MAGLMWRDDFGDRHSALVALVCGARSSEIHAALSGALLTDAEMSSPGVAAGYDDPFGDWHEDPCGHRSDAAEADAVPGTTEGKNR